MHSGVTGGELGRRPRQRRHHVGGRPRPGRRWAGARRRRTRTTRHPDVVAALVDGDQDRHHPRRTGIGGQVLMGAEPGPAGLLVVDLVLEAHHRRHRAPWPPPAPAGPPARRWRNRGGRPTRSRSGRWRRPSRCARRTGPNGGSRPATPRPRWPRLAAPRARRRRRPTAGSATPPSRAALGAAPGPRPRLARSTGDPVGQGGHGAARHLGGVVGTAQLDGVTRRRATTKNGLDLVGGERLRPGRPGCGCSRRRAATGTTASVVTR